MQTAVLLPDPSLRGYIHHYWVMKADRISVEMNILPTGLMKWMFHRRDPLMVNGTLDYDKVATVCGQYRHSINVQTSENTHMLTPLPKLHQTSDTTLH